MPENIFNVYFALLVLLLCSISVNSNAGVIHEVKIVDLNGGKVPDAEVDASGRIHAVYLLDNNIYYVHSSDDGTSFSAPIQVNSEQGFATGGLFRGPDIALGTDGRVHISWYNNGYAQKRPKSEWGFMYSRLDASKTGFEANRNLSRGPSDNYSLAADSEGNVAAVWVKDGLYISRSRDGGQYFEPPVKMEADPCECCATRSIFSKQGELYYLYRDKEDNQRDMYIGNISDTKKPSKRLKLNDKSWYFESCPLSGNNLAWHNHRLLTAWELEGNIYFTQVDNKGELSKQAAINIAESGKYPIVLGMKGNILVAWKSGRKLYWQLLDENSNRKGEPHMVKTNSASRPAGVVTNNGKVLLFP